MHIRFSIALCGVLWILAPVDVRASDRPNVLFIAVDDLRPELGCYGVPAVHSPRIDALANSGVKFSRAYCQQAVCNPSRVSLLTGLRPDSARVWDLVTQFRTTVPDVVTLPQHFMQHGYYSVAYGKIFHNPFPDPASFNEPNHWPEHANSWSEESRRRLVEYRKKMKADGKSDAAIARMRAPAIDDEDVPDNARPDGEIADQAIAAMQRLAAGEQPFFLAVGFIRPHLPFTPPKKYWDMYNPAQLSLAPNPMLPVGSTQIAMDNMYELRDYMDFAETPTPFEGSLTEAQQRQLKHGYYASASFVDTQVGRLLDSMHDLELDNNTVVVFWADHGWKLGEHNSWTKQTNYEIDTRVPLLIRYPNMTSAGRTCDALVELLDIYPTLCDLAGLPIPTHVEGTSLKPLMSDPQAPGADAAFSQFRRRRNNVDYMGYAMRTDRYRYAEWFNRATGKIVARELFDHAVDPQENTNVVREPAHQMLRDQLHDQMWKKLGKPALTESETVQQSSSPAPGYSTQQIAGWNVHTSDAFMTNDASRADQVLSLLEEKLKEVAAGMPAQALAELHNVPIWIGNGDSRGPRGEYHPSAAWLRDHHLEPAKAKGIEFDNPDFFLNQMRNQPMMVLHELAHAYHDRVLGFDQAEILATYQHAAESGIYNSVARFNGSPQRAYAATNAKEYFAESSEAFFGKNDFYPFTRDELLAHDSRMHALLSRVWGMPATTP